MLNLLKRFAQVLGVSCQSTREDTKHHYVYGRILRDDGTVRDRVRFVPTTGRVEFILWKAGEQGHTDDYWHQMGRGWEDFFHPYDDIENSKLEECIQLLTKIAHPVKAMEDEAKSAGYDINGAQCIALANDPEYLKEIARQGLEKLNNESKKTYIS